jgi:hypothetical protein
VTAIAATRRLATRRLINRSLAKEQRGYNRDVRECS